ncbi:PASTA domain-containing protein [Actinomycetospora sp.]|uniref:PASTA domain-containing protein n=1 Tax=Actinomycetospora sp. TaxID=1872135 RepID=UPI0039C867E4
MSRRAVAEVPDLSGLTVAAAENAVLDAGLLPQRVSQGSYLPCAGRQDGTVVCGQNPRPYARMVAGRRVCFWCMPTGDDPPGGGGGGSRLPRGPRPLSPAGSKPL